MFKSTTEFEAPIEIRKKYDPEYRSLYSHDEEESLWSTIRNAHTGPVAATRYCIKGALLGALVGGFYKFGMKSRSKDIVVQRQLMLKPFQ